MATYASFLSAIGPEHLHQRFSPSVSPTPGKGGGKYDEFVPAWNNGDYGTAFRLLQEAIALGLEDPDKASAHLYLAQIHVKRENLSAAVAELQESLRTPWREPDTCWEAAMRLYYVYSEAGLRETSDELHALADYANAQLDVPRRHLGAVQETLRELVRREGKPFLSTEKRCVVCGHSVQGDAIGCPQCGEGTFELPRSPGSEVPAEPAEVIVTALLENGDVGDDAIDAVLGMAANGNVQALSIVEQALQHKAGHKLSYFTPGPRVSAGDEDYGTKSHGKLLKCLLQKARRQTLLLKAAETQDQLIRLFGHVETDRGQFLRDMGTAGGLESVKVVQLLYTHLQVQGHLIHTGVLEPRTSVWDPSNDRPWWKFW